MIGEFKIIGDACYLQVNRGGTLKKLPRLKWYQVIYLAIKNFFKGYVHFSEVEELTRKNPI